MGGGALAFTTAYDIQAGGGVPLYSADEVGASLFAFVVVSILLLIRFAAKRKRSDLFFIPILAVGMLGYLAMDRWDRHATAAALAQNRATRIEGCVSKFITNTGDFYSSRSSRQDEEWDIRGKHFGYKVTSDAPGYHEREARGGVVHAGQYLRVSYLVSPIFRREEITKIEVGPQRCGLR